MAAASSNIITYILQGDATGLDKATKEATNSVNRLSRAVKNVRPNKKLSEAEKQTVNEFKKAEQAVKDYFEVYQREYQRYMHKEIDDVGFRRVTSQLKKLVDNYEKAYARVLRITKSTIQKTTQEQAKEAKSLEERNEQLREMAMSTSSQFKAGANAQVLQGFINTMPNLPPNIVSDINSYIEAWNKAMETLSSATNHISQLKTDIDALQQKIRDITQAIAEGKLAGKDLEAAQNELAASQVELTNKQDELKNETLELANAQLEAGLATEQLNQKSRDYIPAIKAMNQSMNRGETIFAHAARRIIYMVTSLEFWIRTVREGITALSDYVESLNFLDVAQHNIDFSNLVDQSYDAAAALDTFNASLEQARWSLGMNGKALYQSAATFTSFANALKIPGDAVLDFSQNMTQLAYDMASLHNVDVEKMAISLRSALAGNTRSMMRYGVSVHDATLNEWLLSKGLNKTMNDMSEASQTMVRYLYITETLGEAQGDLARTIKSPSNQIKVLKNQITELKKNLASFFNLVIYPAIRLLNEILVPLNAFINAMTSLANSKYSESLGEIDTDLENIGEDAADASKEVKGLSSLDEINQMTNKQSTVKTGVDADVQGLIDAMGVYDGFAERTSKLTEVMISLGNALAPIWEILSDVGVLDLFAKALNLIGYALLPIQAVAIGLRKMFDALPNWLKKTIGFIASLATAIMTLAIVWGLWNAVMSVGKIKTFITAIGTMIVAIGHAIKSFFAMIAAKIKDRIETYKTATANMTLGASILFTLKSILLFIPKLILAGVKALALGLKNLFLAGTFWKVALGVIAAAGIGALVVAGIIGAATLIGAASQKKSEGQLKVQKSAKGGVANGPALSWVGEGAYSEAIVPLGNSPQFISMKESIASEVVKSLSIVNNNGAAAGTGSGRPVVLNIDGRTLARALWPDLVATQYQVGVKLR